MPVPEANPVLQRLQVLVGRWDTKVLLVGGQPLRGRGWTEFAWQEGGQFLVQHADAELPPEAPPEWVANSPMPVTTVIGLDDTSERFTMLYADARGVFRVYQMSLDGGEWRIWREAPGFHQRFTATFSSGGDTITGGWEMSEDGSTWRPDFTTVYTRIR